MYSIEICKYNVVLLTFDTTTGPFLLADVLCIFNIKKHEINQH